MAPGNQVTNDGTWTYTYDAEGNLTKNSKGASAETWLYGYDNRNQMVTAATSATDGGATTQRVTYVYDAFGSRIERDAWDGTTTTTERYGLDGWDPAKPSPVGNENFDTYVELNGSNALVIRRVFGVNFDEVVARQNAVGTVAWYQQDYQGSVRQVIDNSGSVLGSVTYTAYGAVATGSLYDRYGYTGQEFDGITRLWVYNARPYDADLGRFLSEDPSRFAAGDANLYRYVGNGPTNGTDPSGNWITTSSKADADAVYARLKAIPGLEGVIPEPKPTGTGGYVFDAVTDPDGVRKLQTARSQNMGPLPIPRKADGEIDMQQVEQYLRQNQQEMPERKWRVDAITALIGVGSPGRSVGVLDAKSLPRGYELITSQAVLDAELALRRYRIPTRQEIANSPSPNLCGKESVNVSQVPSRAWVGFDGYERDLNGKMLTADSSPIKEAEKTILYGIEVDGKSFPLWKHIMEHFLHTSGTKGESRQKPYMIPDEFKSEVKDHSKIMIHKILNDARAGKIISESIGDSFTIPQQKVRWYSTNLIRRNEKIINHEEKITDDDENLFRAYGGALVTLEGMVIGRNLNADKTVSLTLKVKVTILDNADFSEKGFGRIRLLIPGRLSDIYAAGGALQESNPKASFWHVIEFESEYTIDR